MAGRVRCSPRRGRRRRARLTFCAPVRASLWSAVESQIAKPTKSRKFAHVLAALRGTLIACRRIRPVEAVIAASEQARAAGRRSHRHGGSRLYSPDFRHGSAACLANNSRPLRILRGSSSKARSRRMESTNFAPITLPNDYRRRRLQRAIAGVLTHHKPRARAAAP